MDLNIPKRVGRRSVAFLSAAILASLSPGTLMAQSAAEIALTRPAAPQNGEPFPGRGLGPLLAQQAGDFEVPAMPDRPPEVGGGPRVRVTRFDLEGARSIEDQNIRLAEIETILRTRLSTQPPNGFTIGELQQVADDVSDYYRERGLILAQAYVPAQTVNDGVVRIGVLEGTLGGINVESNDVYDADDISAPFSALIDQPVNDLEIEEVLLTLQEFPGLTVFGTFVEGRNLGQTDLLVRVTDEDRVAVTPMLDNYGSEYTGVGRATLRFDINNAFGIRDRVSFYALDTWSPSSGSYGGIGYQARTRSGKMQFGASASRNSFDIIDTSRSVSLNLQGVVEQRNIFFQQTYTRGRTARYSGTVDVAERNATTTLPGVSPIDELTNVSYTLDFFSTGRRNRGINLGYFRFLAGDNDGPNPSRIDSARNPVSGSFSKLSFSYQRLQRVSQNHSVLLTLDGQQTDDLLVALEQYAIGGPANVRAYPVAEALVDTGGRASVEWIMNAPGFANARAGTARDGTERTWGDIFQFSIFYDYAEGEINDPLPLQASEVDFKGYGAGFQFSYSDYFYMRFDFAKPEKGPTPSNDEDTQIWVSINKKF